MVQMIQLIQTGVECKVYPYDQGCDLKAKHTTATDMIGNIEVSHSNFHDTEDARESRKLNLQ